MSSPLVYIAHNVLEILMLALASTAVMRIWFQGSIFTDWRAYWEARGGLFGELVNCTVCLSPYVTFWLACLYWLPGIIITQEWLDLSGIVFKTLVTVGITQITEDYWPTKLK